MRCVWLGLAAFGLAVAVGCGGSSDADDGGGGSSGSGGSSASGGSAGSSGAAGTAGAAGSGGQGGQVTFGSCADAPPAGADKPAPLPTYSGTCPTLAAGDNTITSSGNQRGFRLALPADMKPGENLPVIFLWHWLGGDAQDFYDKGDVQAAVDSQRFIAVLPEKKGDVLFTWPMEVVSTQARVDEELKFFDDMLACVGSQYTVNENCVASAGVSAGALWTAQLAIERSQHLSSFISLSGGTGGVIRPWKAPEHKMPALVLWGGPTDNCAGLLQFTQTSQNLEDGLASGGHFMIECIHNCGHSQPPFDGSLSTYSGLWQFVLDHPYWLKAGQSPYTSQGLPGDLPTWCGIGKGSATPRTGVCDNPSQC
ncbi:MAG: hypothetical protein R3B13_14180 [Polyangiaceae bacterium]